MFIFDLRDAFYFYGVARWTYLRRERRQARKSFHHFFPSQHVSKLIKSAFQCAWRHHHKPLWVNIHFAIFALSLAQFPCYTINNPSLNSDSTTETLIQASFTPQIKCLSTFNFFWLSRQLAACVFTSPFIVLPPSVMKVPFLFHLKSPCTAQDLIAALYLLINSRWQQRRVSGRIIQRKPSKFAPLWITFPFRNTHLSMLIAQRLRMLAVQRRMSKQVQIVQYTNPSGHIPE